MKPRIFKIPTPQSLTNAAVQYLALYAASEASLRRVLENKLQRVMLQDPDFARSGVVCTLRATIEQIIEKHRTNGVLNDDAFAERRVQLLRRQGCSRRAIAQKLGQKGIAGSLIAAALSKESTGASSDESEYAAALALVRRRKLGPFRKTPADESQKRKDMAALARAGFSYDIARRALKTDAREEAWE